MLKFNSQDNVSMCLICPKLTIKTPVSGSVISLLGTVNNELIHKINLKVF